jgi:hypothetical protein
MKHVSKISRSVFQKKVEENKRLLRDIRVMTMEPGIKAILLRMKWRDRFKHETELNNLLKTAAKKYFNDHPELKIDFPKNN